MLFTDIFLCSKILLMKNLLIREEKIKTLDYMITISFKINEI